jgi:hypothetical protein
VISVLTPTVPERAELLERCKESVRRSQLHTPHTIEHVIVGDGPCEGATYQLRSRTCSPAAPVMVANYMASGDWRIIVPDDDYLWEDGLAQVHSVAVRGDYDFVMGLEGLHGRDDESIREWAHPGNPPKPGATGAFLFHKRLLAIAHLERKSVTGEVGGWPVGCDWVLIRSWLAAGARYACPDIKLLVHREG